MPDPTLFYLGFHPQMRGLEKEFITVTTMLGELEAEKDQVYRFLTYALAFNVPIQAFFEELNSDILTEHFDKNPIGTKLVEDSDYLENTMESFRTYMEQHHFIVEVLAERQMENILLGDVLGD